DVFFVFPDLEPDRRVYYLHDDDRASKAKCSCNCYSKRLYSQLHRVPIQQTIRPCRVYDSACTDAYRKGANYAGYAVHRADVQCVVDLPVLLQEQDSVVRRKAEHYAEDERVLRADKARSRGHA